MYSVDIAPSYPLDKSKSTGFMAEKAKEALNVKNHKIYLGAGVTNFLEEIGKGIDFAILDTAHALPGEILDFLVILPYLNDNAVVCLHDVAESQYSKWRAAYATTLLLSSVTAKKMINLIPENHNSKFLFPNIAAFQINEDTRKNIIDVVMTLTIPWNFLPSNIELKRYAEFIRYYYRKFAAKAPSFNYGDEAAPKICGIENDNVL